MGSDPHKPVDSISDVGVANVAVSKLVQEELDRQNKYLDFAQQQIEKDRGFYKHLFSISATFLAFMVAVGGYFSYTSLSQMRSDIKTSAEAELTLLRAQTKANGDEARATVNNELANVRTEVQKRIDTEFRSDNIAALVATVAKERTDKELSGIINREVAAKFASRSLPEAQAKLIADALHPGPDGKVSVRTGSLPEQQLYARKIYDALLASASWRIWASYAEPGSLRGMTNDRALLLDGVVVVVSDTARPPKSARTLEAALKAAAIADVRVGTCDCEDPPKDPDIWLYVGAKTY